VSVATPAGSASLDPGTSATSSTPASAYSANRARTAGSSPVSDTCPTISAGIAASSSPGCGRLRAKLTTSPNPASANISP
jgi:hypothetical protein